MLIVLFSSRDHLLNETIFKKSFRKIPAVEKYIHVLLSTILMYAHPQAHDSGVPPLSASTTVKITVLDINDNSPTFDTSYTNIPEVAENTHPFTEVRGIIHSL